MTQNQETPDLIAAEYMDRIFALIGIPDNERETMRAACRGACREYASQQLTATRAELARVKAAGNGLAEHLFHDDTCAGRRGVCKSCKAITEWQKANQV